MPLSDRNGCPLRIIRGNSGPLASCPFVPEFSMHRGILNAIMLAVVRERAGPDAVREGHRCLLGRLRLGVEVAYCRRDGAWALKRRKMGASLDVHGLKPRILGREVGLKLSVVLRQRL